MDENRYRQISFVNKWNLMNAKQLISETYPEIEVINIKLDFDYKGINTVKKSIEKNYSLNDKAFFLIDCINSECVDSDLDLSQEIHSMILKKETISIGKKICNGYQDYERFKARNYHCLAAMTFEINIEYNKTFIDSLIN